LFLSSFSINPARTLFLSKTHLKNIRGYAVQTSMNNAMMDGPMSATGWKPANVGQGETEGVSSCSILGSKKKREAAGSPPLEKMGY
jgi:hypothetical protein